MREDVVSYVSAHNKEIRPMMGYGPLPNDPLFSYKVQLETRVRKDHPLRKIKELVDFDFIYKDVEKTYGTNGNVSVPPPVVLKFMLLLVLYNVRSERELMDTLPERLDWLWFLGYTIESPIPDHSVLSKARKRWGTDAFRRFFETVVSQCVRAGLVDGTKIFIDASYIEANASNNSVINTKLLDRYLKKGYREFEKRLDERDDHGETHLRSDVNKRRISTTDPDASIVSQGSKPKLYYKTHRTVDPSEVITAVEVTTGSVNEAHRMLPLVDRHEATTGGTVSTVVADSKYGTIDNFVALDKRKIEGHIPLLKKTHEHKGRKAGIFQVSAFTHDPTTDTLICPAGKRLTKRTFHEQRQTTEYMASRKDCRSCSLRPRCTRNALARSVQRHRSQAVIDDAVKILKSWSAKTDLATRKHLMERSFARATRYTFDRARWRGLCKVTIQEYLIATIQNIETLIRLVRKPTKGVRSAPLTTLGRVLWLHITFSLSAQWSRAMMSGFMAPWLPQAPET
jgi:transposase